MLQLIPDAGLSRGPLVGPHLAKRVPNLLQNPANSSIAQLAPQWEAPGAADAARSINHEVNLCTAMFDQRFLL